MPCLDFGTKNVKGREEVESDLQQTRLSLLAHSEGQPLSCRKLRGLPRRKADCGPVKGLRIGKWLQPWGLCAVLQSVFPEIVCFKQDIILGGGSL